MKKKLVLTVSIVVLAVMIAVMCVACTPNSDSVIKKLEKNGCEIMDMPTLPSNVEKAIMAGNEKGELLYVTWYKSEKDAKDAYNKAKKAMDELDQDELEEYGADYTIKRKGKACIAGSKALVKLV